MKKALLLALALAVIPVGVDARGIPSASCAEVTFPSPLEDLTRCAEQGHARAQYLLGLRYNIGHDAPQDDAEAFLWYRQAAEQGHASAQLDLGYQYAWEGFLHDLVYAYMWWNLSAAQGTETAQESKDIIERQMTREQIAEGQRMSREWLEAHPPGSN